MNKSSLCQSDHVFGFVQFSQNSPGWSQINPKDKPQCHCEARQMTGSFNITRTDFIFHFVDCKTSLMTAFPFLGELILYPLHTDAGYRPRVLTLKTTILVWGPEVASLSDHCALVGFPEPQERAQNSQKTLRRTQSHSCSCGQVAPGRMKGMWSWTLSEKGSFVSDFVLHLMSVLDYPHLV